MFSTVELSNFDGFDTSSARFVLGALRFLFGSTIVEVTMIRNAAGHRLRLLALRLLIFSPVTKSLSVTRRRQARCLQEANIDWLKLPFGLRA
jgi:hypothetical protein